MLPKNGKKRYKKFQDSEAVKHKKISKKDPDDSTGKSSEMFRTDLLQAMRADLQLFEGDAPLIPIQDKWKEEWNHGIQVCVNDHLDAPPPTETVFNPYPENYVIPKKRIACYPSAQLGDGDFKHVPVPSRMYYSGGDFDLRWMELINERRAKMKLKQMTINELYEVLNSLEYECYQNTHFELLQPVRRQDEEDASCDICGIKESEADDEIVFCDGCNLSVHQSCYGLMSIPTHDWLCTCCALRYGKKTRCVLCPNLGGAMKCTADGTLWAHVACALWMPEVRFIDIDRREPISNISDIHRDRLQMRCSVCDLKEGACIQCTAKNCTAAFHVVCGYRKKLTLRIEDDETAPDGVKMTSLCWKHTKQEQELGRYDSDDSHESFEERESTPQNDALDKIERYFPLYVDVNKVAQELDINEDIVKDVFAYWLCKREDNNRRPMIHEPVGIDMSQNSRVDCHPSTLDEKIRRIIDQRGNMERARNLCYQIGQREKTKKTAISTKIDIFDKTIEMFNTPTVPVNMRVLTKMNLFDKKDKKQPFTVPPLQYEQLEQHFNRRPAPRTSPRKHERLRTPPPVKQEPQQIQTPPSKKREVPETPCSVIAYRTQTPSPKKIALSPKKQQLSRIPKQEEPLQTSSGTTLYTNKIIVVSGLPELHRIRPEQRRARKTKPFDQATGRTPKRVSERLAEAPKRQAETLKRPAASRSVAATLVKRTRVEPLFTRKLRPRNEPEKTSREVRVLRDKSTNK
ncbi:hypothetical protein L596_017195 [Steinernema carpocapsae]|uniref:PHD-type domain-containing protein n=1 Tax=Steinernema carpocapsae TaxID=34508 RepID=A0A4U5N163_STECR|nr:hypothetical protein L596_017195 [Steinernema carpocapsae]